MPVHHEKDAIRPWAYLTEALVESEGDYADFVAWENWMHDIEHAALMEPFTAIDRLEFYALCCNLWDHRPTELM